jgi:hypothetical protein
MRGNLILLALSLLVPAHEVAAQEPARLRLPDGARVRVTTAAGGAGIQGVLVRSDERRLTLALPGPSPYAPPSELTLRVEPTTRVELYAGSRRHTWLGAVIGGVAMGLTGVGAPIDPYTCNDYYSSTFCSRGEAIAISAAAGALIGGAVGYLVQTDRWSKPIAVGPPE